MTIFGLHDPVLVPLDHSYTLLEVYNYVCRYYNYTFLFESLIGPKELSEVSAIGFDPSIVIKVYHNKIILKYRNNRKILIKTTEPFITIKKFLPKTNNNKYRYIGGAVGIINYDAIQLWEKSIHKNIKNDLLMEFGIYDDGIIADKKNNKQYYFYYDENRINKIKISKNNFKQFKISKFSVNFTSKHFSNMIKKAKQYIHDGDIFQVVLSRRINFDVSGDLLKIYNILRKINPSPYLYHIKMNKKTVIGASPEMLLRVTDDKVETFPIAGTRKISKNKLENKKLMLELQKNEKEVAEHTMLVDLGRNDIGKVCKYGTVQVKELMQIKQFSHVQHMVTHIIGKLNKQYDMFDAFKAVFPAGTVSGAPKIRAMEIIDELETEKRGSYAGAIGYFSFNGCCDFAILIRSIFINKTKGFIQSGAGIVLDSVFQNELKELEHKAEAMIKALKIATR